jgi:hypothetical protein
LSISQKLTAYDANPPDFDNHETPPNQRPCGSGRLSLNVGVFCSGCSVNRRGISGLICRFDLIARLIVFLLLILLHVIFPLIFLSLILSKSDLALRTSHCNQIAGILNLRGWIKTSTLYFNALVSMTVRATEPRRLSWLSCTMQK